MIPRGLWEDMSIDFITKLPKSKDPVTGITYNLIIVIVDRFTKYLIVVLFKETHTAEQLGYLLLDRLVRDHRVLIMIITDRDKLFTSNYWKTISAAMGTKPKKCLRPITHKLTARQSEQTKSWRLTYSITSTRPTAIGYSYYWWHSWQSTSTDQTQQRNHYFLPILDNMRTSGC